MAGRLSAGGAVAAAVTPLGDAAGALAWARAILIAAPDSEPLDAPLLLAHILAIPRAALLAHPEHTLTAEQSAMFRALIVRRAAGEPVAYLTGTRAFYDRAFRVTPDVLIPRPETEHLIAQALAWAIGRSALRIVDVGTGSGAIAVTLAAHLPDAHVWAVDVSAAALAVARENAARQGVADRVTCVQGDLLAPAVAAQRRADLIAANLPYIARPDLDALAVSHWEPRLALDGGPDGLDLIRRLLADVPRVLAPDGLLLLEIGAEQGAAVCALAQQALPGAVVRTAADYAGLDRVVSVQPGGDDAAYHVG